MKSQRVKFDRKTMLRRIEEWGFEARVARAAGNIKEADRWDRDVQICHEIMGHKDAKRAERKLRNERRAV